MSNNIEIAVHIRSIINDEQFERLFTHLKGFYDSDLFSKTNLEKHTSLNVTRLYVGDEFCPHRLPILKKLKEFSRFALEKQLSLTMLTPPMSDREIARHSNLFEYLNDNHDNKEVVANDIGVILYLKKKFPLLRLAAGRLLNKAFKDPRLMDAEGLSAHSKEAEILLNECTFDNEALQKMMTGLNVRRLEQDLLPYGDSTIQTISGICTSLYFPFGAITSGRICWISTFDQPEKFWFMPIDKCSRPCESLRLNLKNKNFAFQVVQGGNTIFYLYPLARLADLLDKADRQDIRLVYQGYAL